MDESFQRRRGRSQGESQPAPLDYSMLSAALIAQQAATPAARAQARFEAGAARRPGPDVLIEAVLSASDTYIGASARLGCFNRAEVRRRLNTP
ncbi:MAG TPA: hypothetical protein VIT38_08635 [Allosphingosinicella sp.]|jgi:hypothetical protein